ncbi:MAG: transporter substrate-binding protein [Magnetospirillum sp.]|nr:transporter substrate-binding protein [Magnetospirillum sp.]
MDRRHFLMGAAMAVGLGPGRALARNFSRAPARVALLLPLTGAAAALGQLLQGTALAAADAINRAGLGGERAVQLQIEDWASEPRRFDALARRFATGEGRPAAVFGPCPGGLREELGRYLDAVDGVLWDPGGYEGGECSAGILHFGPTPHQSLTQALPFLAAELGGRFLLVPGEGSHARGLSRLSRWALGRMGAEVVGEADPDNRQAWLARAGREQVNVVICTLEGSELADFLRAYAALRLDPQAMPIFNPLMTELDVRAVGPALAAGHVACQPYFADWRTLGNDRFQAALGKRLGPDMVPTVQAEALWGQLHLFAAAIAALDDVTPHPMLVREAARGREVLLPQGRVRLDGATLHPGLWPKLAVATPEGGFKVIARSERPIPARPFWGWGEGAARLRSRRTTDFYLYLKCHVRLLLSDNHLFSMVLLTKIK